MRDAFKKLSSIDAGKVLDAATGRGEFIHTIKQTFASFSQIIGVDVSDKAVLFAQKVHPENNIEVYRMDLQNLSFTDGYFDTVCISNSLHHLADVDKVLSELLRVLKPGGMLLVTEMYRDGIQSEAQKTHIAMHHWVASIDRLQGVSHGMTFAKQEIIDFILKWDLNNIEIEDFYYPVDNPKDAKNCESLHNNCKESLKRLESLENTDDLIREGHLLQERINKVGCASASRLLITAIKK